MNKRLLRLFIMTGGGESPIFTTSNSEEESKIKKSRLFMDILNNNTNRYYIFLIRL